MMLSPAAPSRLPPAKAARTALFAATLLSACLGAASASFAQQASGCGDIQKMLTERKSIGDRISAATSGKKQIDAKRACTDFGALVSNGNGLIKWVDTNKEWCQIPDNFAASIKEDHGRAIKIRGQACGAAAKQAQMEKQAREGASTGLLGGGGLSGATRLPQGAL